MLTRVVAIINEVICQAGSRDHICCWWWFWGERIVYFHFCPMKHIDDIRHSINWVWWIGHLLSEIRSQESLRGNSVLKPWLHSASQLPVNMLGSSQDGPSPCVPVADMGDVSRVPSPSLQCAFLAQTGICRVNQPQWASSASLLLFFSVSLPFK